MRSVIEDSPSDRVAFLKAMPLFAPLSEAALAAVASDLHLKEYQKNEIIFHQGDDSQELYLVRAGKVRIFKISRTGAETSINLCSTHDIIGEFATLDGQPRSATAKAITFCRLYQLSQAHFLQHMQEISDLGLSLARLLVGRLRWTDTYAETIAQYDAPGRLLHILLFYNEQFGQEIERGKRYVLDLALTQADLASLVGSNREWVNRLLKDWRKRGLIDYQNGQIFILDLSGVCQERDRRLEGNREKKEIRREKLENSPARTGQGN
jgi:CRP-like cAMP-binding protein